MVFIPGVSTLREVPQDEEENAKTYAESQQQRALERKLREEKRDLEVLKAQGASEEEIKAQRDKVRKASGDIDRFCDETGRTRDRSREYTPINATWPDQEGYTPPTTQVPQVAPQQITQNVAPQATQNPAPVVQSISGAKDFSELRTVMQDKYGITVDSAVDSLDFDMVHEAMQGVESMFAKYPALTSTIKTIDTRQSGVMSCNGISIHFNPDWFTTRDKINDAIAQATKSHWWPANTTLQSIAAHECGHGLEWLAIVNDPQFSGPLAWNMRVDAWAKNTIASKIVSEAAKAAKKQPYGKGKKIAELVESVSTYAKKSRGETMAESFGDVQANGANAAPFSREVVRVTEELLKQLLGGGTP